MKARIKLILVLLSLNPLYLLATEQSINPALNAVMMPQPQMVRDPFSPSLLMFDVLGEQSRGGGGAFGFTYSPNDSVPKMRLRGFVTQDKETPLALLEVAGSRTFIVREGDEINIDPLKPLSVIRITKITRQSITVETGRLGSIRVQR